MPMDKAQAKAMVMQLRGWDEAKFSEMEEWAKQNCICGECPTYLVDEQQCAFCWPTVGQAQLITEEKNCICGQCPVFNQSDQRFAYYCTRDSEIAQTTEMTEQAAA